MIVQHVVKISFSVTTQVAVSQHYSDVMVVMGVETGLMNSTVVSHASYISLLSKYFSIKISKKIERQLYCVYINDKNCSSSTVLTAKHQKLQK